MAEFQKIADEDGFLFVPARVEDCLKDGPPKTSGNEQDIQVRISYAMWMEADYFYRNHIMNCLYDSLYRLYTPVKIDMEMWE